MYDPDHMNHDCPTGFVLEMAGNWIIVQFVMSELVRSDGLYHIVKTFVGVELLTTTGCDHELVRLPDVFVTIVLPAIQYDSL